MGTAHSSVKLNINFFAVLIGVYLKLSPIPADPEAWKGSRAPSAQILRLFPVGEDLHHLAVYIHIKRLSDCPIVRNAHVLPSRVVKRRLGRARSVPEMEFPTVLQKRYIALGSKSRRNYGGVQCQY